MKKNRSNKFTQGIVITNNTNDKRFLFFELDMISYDNNHEVFNRIIGVYQRFGLDVCRHRSYLGWHCLRPTLLDLETWKKAMAELKDINKKCPMTTLRVEPNKYPNEADIWYLYEWYNFNSDRNNSIECINFLNKMWNIPDEELYIYRNANTHTDLKFVRYPLP